MGPIFFEGLDDNPSRLASRAPSGGLADTAPLPVLGSGCPAHGGTLPGEGTSARRSTSARTDREPISKGPDMAAQTNYSELRCTGMASRLSAFRKAADQPMYPMEVLDKGKPILVTVGDDSMQGWHPPLPCLTRVHWCSSLCGVVPLAPQKSWGAPFTVYKCQLHRCKWP